MTDFKIIDQHIELTEKPKKLKKMTATKFASALGLNHWSTPFQQWCEITHTCNMPFEDTKYTIAGKVIEPKIIKYLQDVYFLDIKAPADVYGADYFAKTYGDFYPQDKIFGGMWDAKSDDTIVEIKTTSRPEDWLNEIPIYYKLQACLYAHLSGIDTVYMVCAFLKDEDYLAPEAFVPSSQNTIVRSFSLSTEYPDFVADYVKPALDWWVKYVERGVSPDFDEKLDAEYLKEIRTSYIDGDASLKALLNDIDAEEQKIAELKVPMADIEKSLKKHKETLKKYLTGQFKGTDKMVKVASDNYTYTYTKTIKSVFDEDTFKKDHPDLYKKYSKNDTSYTLRGSKNK